MSRTIYWIIILRRIQFFDEWRLQKPNMNVEYAYVSPIPADSLHISQILIFQLRNQLTIPCFDESLLISLLKKIKLFVIHEIN